MAYEIEVGVSNTVTGTIRVVPDSLDDGDIRSAVERYLNANRDKPDSGVDVNGDEGWFMDDQGWWIV